MVAVVVAVLAGAVLLFPALALLFTLTLRGHLGAHGAEAEPVATAGQSGVAQLLLGPTLGARLAVALLIVGIGLLNVADAPWAHAIGVDQPARLHPRGVRRARAPGAGRGRLSVALCAERAPNARRGELSALGRAAGRWVGMHLLLPKHVSIRPDPHRDSGLGGAVLSDVG